MILSSTSTYGILKVFSIACGYQKNTVFRKCYIKDTVRSFNAEKL